MRLSDGPAPWPYYTAKQAAKVLGVSADLVRGSVGPPKVRRHVEQGRREPVPLYCREDVDALAEEMARIKSRGAR